MKQKSTYAYVDLYLYICIYRNSYPNVPASD